MPHRIVILFESGEQQSLYLQDWADIALQEFAAELQNSRHVRQVNIIAADPIPVPPPSPSRGASAANAVGRVVMTVIGVVLILIGLALTFDAPGGCPHVWSTEGLCGVANSSSNQRTYSLLFLIPGILLVGRSFFSARK